MLSLRILLASMATVALLPQAAPEPLPTRLVVIADVSVSMTRTASDLVGDNHGPWMDELAKALNKVSVSLDSRDELCIATVARAIKFAPCTPGGSTAAGLAAVDQWGAPSPVMTAIATAASRFARAEGPLRRTAIIVITDGLSHGNTHSLQETATLASANGMAVFPIHTTMVRQLAEQQAAAKALFRDLANRTGGQFAECGLARSTRPCASPTGVLAEVILDIYQRVKR